MTPDLFKLIAPHQRMSFAADGIEMFKQSDRDAWGEYQFVSGDAADYLKTKTYSGSPAFEWVDGEKVDSVLDSAEAAAKAIKEGDHDDILDLLLYAERQKYGSRTSVVEAIVSRNNELAREAEPDETETITPSDIVST